MSVVHTNITARMASLAGLDDSLTERKEKLSVLSMGLNIIMRCMIADLVSGTPSSGWVQQMKWLMDFSYVTTEVQYFNARA